MRVAASSPLLRRGLARAAEAAGFVVASGDLAARVILRAEAGADPCPSESIELEITVKPDTVVVTVRQIPDQPMALLLQQLLNVLLAKGSAEFGHPQG